MRTIGDESRLCDLPVWVQRRLQLTHAARHAAGYALSELSALGDFRRLDLPTRPAHDLAKHRRQPDRAAVLAPVEPVGPIRSLRLAPWTDQYLPAARDRPRPRSFLLIRIVGPPSA
jgi:hypothetical protein